MASITVKIIVSVMANGVCSFVHCLQFPFSMDYAALFKACFSDISFSSGVLFRTYKSITGGFFTPIWPLVLSFSFKFKFQTLSTIYE